MSTKSTPRPTKPAEPPPAERSVGNWYDNYDPAHFAVQVRKSAKKAAVNPQLLMAILYNEDYKPHNPELERSWQRIKPDASFGIANMHRAAFNETKRNATASPSASGKSSPTIPTWPSKPLPGTSTTSRTAFRPIARPNSPRTN